ncbi:carboxypeptidase-like regulatory domain-containing protein [Gilvibacter sp.]|uniref:carboxypeptidase-like regulatory domain-containing protein n=1 Tax=Gilvibacter sp. TaxID=2729997 RepID=UPI003F4A3E79
MNVLKTNYLFLLLFLTVLVGRAQHIELEGKLLNNSDIEGVHVLNKSKGINTITDQDGRFEIRVSLADTLYFSSVRYQLKELVVDSQMMQSGYAAVVLDDRVTELDEVFIKPALSGNLQQDAQDIEVETPINFNDVGIPGFIGEPEEKIVPIITGIGTITTVDLEVLYKHMSGYYKKLRIKRKWEQQNQVVSQILALYSVEFFKESYGLPQERIYDFLLFCIETTSVQRDFEVEQYGLVLNHFEERSGIYLERLEESED